MKTKRKVKNTVRTLRWTHLHYHDDNFEVITAAIDDDREFSIMPCYLLWTVDADGDIVDDVEYNKPIAELKEYAEKQWGGKLSWLELRHDDGTFFIDGYVPHPDCRTVYKIIPAYSLWVADSDGLIGDPIADDSDLSKLKAVASRKLKSVLKTPYKRRPKKPAKKRSDAIRHYGELNLTIH